MYTRFAHHPESLFNALWPELSWGLVLRFRPTTTSQQLLFLKVRCERKQHRENNAKDNKKFNRKESFLNLSESIITSYGMHELS